MQQTYINLKFFSVWNTISTAQLKQYTSTDTNPPTNDCFVTAVSCKNPPCHLHTLFLFCAFSLFFSFSFSPLRARQVDSIVFAVLFTVSKSNSFSITACIFLPYLVLCTPYNDVVIFENFRRHVQMNRRRVNLTGGQLRRSNYGYFAVNSVWG